MLGRRFEVRPLAYRREAFAAPGDRSPIAPLNLMREDGLKALLRTEMSSQPLDAYIVIVKAGSTIGPGNRTVEGIGAVEYDAIFGSHEQLHALYEIKVIDGHSFDVIEARTAAPLDKTDLTKLAGPSQEVEKRLMPSADAAAPDDALRQATADMIGRSLPLTLRDLRLTDDR
jgi:hypothetical protein